jgi:hypothetical protein
MLKKIKICLILLPLFANILQAQSNHTKQLFVTAGGQFGYGETRVGDINPTIIPQWNCYGGLNIDANYKIFGIQASALLEKRSTLNRYPGSTPNLDISLDYISLQGAAKLNLYGGFYVTIGHYYSWLNSKKIENSNYPNHAHYVDSTMIKTDHGMTASIGYNILKNEHLFICLEGNYKQGWVQIFEPSFPTLPNHGLPASVYDNGINRLLGFSIVVKQRIFYKTFK